MLADNPSFTKKEAAAKDYQLEATAAWNYAIDPSTLKFQQAPTSGNLQSPIFDSHLPPVSITVTACPIQWNTTGSLVATSPPESPKCTGSQKTITLTPYGVSLGHGKIVHKLICLPVYEASNRRVPYFQSNLNCTAEFFCNTSITFFLTDHRDICFFCLVNSFEVEMSAM